MSWQPLVVVAAFACCTWPAFGGLLAGWEFGLRLLVINLATFAVLIGTTTVAYWLLQAGRGRVVRRRSNAPAGVGRRLR